MIKCIAIDDEELALELLVDNINNVPYLELVGTASNTLEATDLLSTNEVDLLFLDIQMPGLSGIQFLKTLTQSPMVIFHTAYEEYALTGFELNVVDYLLKPVSFERFLKACNRAQEFYNLKNATSREIGSDYFFVNSEYSLVKIKYAEILYIEGLKDYIKIYIEDVKRPVITRMTMKSIEEKLIPYNFMRVHKSYIISLPRIKSIRNLKVTINEIQIPVSEQNIEQLMSKIGGS
ncbi:MAG: two-component system LytT family response regulator [Spirosomataceae bacterium]|jgi:two-component system LytT family response regulator